MRIKIYCGEAEFTYVGAFSTSVRLTYKSIRSIRVYPLWIIISVDEYGDIKIPSPCVIGIRAFVNIAGISDIGYN